MSMLNKQPSLASARFEASLIIRRYGFTSPDQIHLEDIAYADGIVVESASLKKIEALLLRKKNRGIIHVSDRIANIGRRRFAIAHELGHWHCHSSLSQAWLCTADAIHAYKGSAVELEANAFAAELLMPKQMILQEVGTEELSIQLACRIADAFQTTLTATAIRIIEESKGDYCVLFSENNAVRWSKKSRTAADIWMPNTINPASRAWDCDTEPADAIGLRKTSPEFWLSGRTLREYSEVWEESVLLGDYGTVLTLLYFS